MQEEYAVEKIIVKKTKWRLAPLSGKKKSICSTVAMYLKKKQKQHNYTGEKQQLPFFPALPFSKFVLCWAFSFLVLLWPHLTEHCRISGVQKSVTISLRCFVLSLSQLTTHTFVSKSIKMSNRCLQAEKGFVTWVWISSLFSGKVSVLWMQRVVFPLCSAAARAFYGCFSEEKDVSILHQLPLFMVLGILLLGWKRVKMLVLCCYSTYHNFQMFPTIKMN